MKGPLGGGGWWVLGDEPKDYAGLGAGRLGFKSIQRFIIFPSVEDVTMVIIYDFCLSQLEWLWSLNKIVCLQTTTFTILKQKHDW